MLGELGIVGVDHVAVTSANFQQTLDGYLAMPGARLSGGPHWNPTQKVFFAFVDLAPGMRIEVLGRNAEIPSPIDQHISAGGGAYHVCYIVRDLDAALARAITLGAKVVTSAIADIAFDGRRIAFIFAVEFGLLELVEAGATGSSDASSDNRDLPIKAVELPSSIARKPENFSAEKLKSLMLSIFPDLGDVENSELEIGACKAWDSLGQLQLIMAVERNFEVNIPSEKISNLTSFTQIADYLSTAVADND